jgi:hypothetical protein
MIYEPRLPDTLKSGIFSHRKIPVNTVFLCIFTTPRKKTRIIDSHAKSRMKKHHPALTITVRKKKDPVGIPDVQQKSGEG